MSATGVSERPAGEAADEHDRLREVPAAPPRQAHHRHMSDDATPRSSRRAELLALYSVRIYKRADSHVAVIKSPDGSRAGTAEAPTASGAWAGAVVAAYETVARETN